MQPSPVCLVQSTNKKIKTQNASEQWESPQIRLSTHWQSKLSSRSIPEMRPHPILSQTKGGNFSNTQSSRQSFNAKPFLKTYITASEGSLCPPFITNARLNASLSYGPPAHQKRFEIILENYDGWMR
ncbi:hypothetical protein CEXT_522631 [Caerostris extrusa]|uniref:Uncharacterized protein n=1 Tax=Caerostris extrusa TaxID=172846 RepID=A0AAV4MNK3_CAEEX|nr:hypothetical protein CEXT_522631 [Caerostris extrusa]